MGNGGSRRRLGRFMIYIGRLEGATYLGLLTGAGARNARIVHGYLAAAAGGASRQIRHLYRVAAPGGWAHGTAIQGLALVAAALAAEGAVEGASGF